MVLIKADMQDYNRVTAFYKYVIDNAEDMEYMDAGYMASILPMKC